MFLLALFFLCGAVTCQQNYDLRIVSTSQVLYDDYLDTSRVYSVEFTASQRPDVEWYIRESIYGAEVLSDTTFDFADGRGRVSVTVTDMTYRTRLFMKIGTFFRQYYVISWWKTNSNNSHTLNTIPMSLSSSYNVTYDSGEDFVVTLAAAKTPMEGMEGTAYRQVLGRWERPEGWVFVYPVLPESGFSFLQLSKNETARDDIMSLTFSPSIQPINGIFELQSYADPTSDFVYKVEEHVLFAVHQAVNPGPFSRGFIYISPDRTPFCPSTGNGEEARCYIKCTAFANSINHVAIINLHEDGSNTTLPVERNLVDWNPSFVEFIAWLPISPPEGAYSCRVETSDGNSKEVRINVN